MPSSTRTTQIVTGFREVPSGRSAAISSSSAASILFSSSSVQLVICRLPCLERSRSVGLRCGCVLFVCDLFHPVHDLAVETFLNLITHHPQPILDTVPTAKNQRFK